ncbi:MAG: DNA-formamidopyrimidine glycosylase family protein, partial [Ilumatobacter sp.]
MPEGDTLRLLATRINDRLGGGVVERSVVRDPRLVGVDLTGTTLVGANAYGKHLFIRFDDGRSLHAHLLMTGGFAVGRASRE